MSDVFLKPEEVRRLADGRKTRPAIMRRLKAKRIPCELSGREVLVSRAFVERRLGVEPDTPAPDGYANEPDFSHFENQR